MPALSPTHASLQQRHSGGERTAESPSAPEAAARKTQGPNATMPASKHSAQGSQGILTECKIPKLTFFELRPNAAAEWTAACTPASAPMPAACLAQQHVSFSRLCTAGSLASTAGACVTACSARSATLASSNTGAPALAGGDTACSSGAGTRASSTLAASGAGSAMVPSTAACAAAASGDASPAASSAFACSVSCAAFAGVSAGACPGEASAAAGALSCAPAVVGVAAFGVSTGAD
eukprot:CAMPEP_0170378436 /NCGR_PEP_ID=MMETSP0117_2-20130122/12810_1 /TAXON_ID=400756 /ORGANISM="Durinskia baltica, Strain CSIRO CS-38" /LENGTH=235 /DNA_ID=CAMNT_0010633811 /DNA_START=69 /DNA_END=773 /DNA_ORIENTATION=+